MPPKEKKNPIYKEYVLLTIDCMKKYGPKTIVLWRSGIFYEVYSKIGDSVLFDEFLKVTGFRSSMDASGRRMAGLQWFNLYDEHLDTLIQAGFTVVVSEQKPQRHIADVITPGTHIPAKGVDSNKLCVICFTEGATKTHPIFIIGIAVIDATTGQSTVDEIICNSLSEVYSTLPDYINAIHPKEIVFTSSEKKKSLLDVAKTTFFGEHFIPRTVISIKDELSKLPSQFENEVYQRNLLEKVFPSRNALSVFENCGIEEMVSGRKAYTFLLHYVHDQNENALNGIDYPLKLAVDANHLQFSSSSAKHLSFVELDNILNKCKTAMGRRMMTNRLNRPLISVSEMNKSYDQIESMTPHTTTVRAILERAYDLERWFRLMERGRLHPCDLWKLTSTLGACVSIHEVVGDIIPFSVEAANECTNYINKHINTNLIHGIKFHSITDTFFQPGIHSHIDALQEVKDAHYELAKKIRTAIPSSKLEKKSKAYVLQISKDKWEKVKGTLTGVVVCGQKELKLESIKPLPNRSDKTYDLSHKIIEELFVTLLRYDDQIAAEVSKSYSSFITSFVSKFRDVIKNIIQYVAEIDWYSNLAYIAQTYRYKRPVCIESDKAFVKLKNARHPIVEVIEVDVPYVPLTLELVPNESVVVLYGVNASGKSTSVKTIGCLVAMAQAGMFVPADHMELSPYDKLFVRVPTGDSIMKGKSTFENEAGEFRVIIKDSNSRSLVIGDELCSGTESESATSIVATGLCHLEAKGATVIFATHYHTLTKLQSIQNMISSKKLRVYHHSVIWDEGKKLLIYDRLLKEGQGSSLYGLEVCKSLGFNDEFLQMANEFRKELAGVGALLDHKTSVYNVASILDLCVVCKINPAVDTHHIQRQELADKDGFIGHFHKNRKSNLTGICKQCHDRETYHGESIVGYVKTSEGVMLQRSEPKPSEPKVKYSQDVMDKVRELSAKKYSIKRISIECGITPYAVNKILKEGLKE